MTKIMVCRLIDGTYNAWFDGCHWLFLKNIQDDDSIGFGLAEEEAIADLKTKHPFIDVSEVIYYG